MKSYTTIEQSKKLLELGLSPESADMCYKTVDVDNAESDEDCVFDLVCKPYTEYLKYVIPLGLNYKAIPCWSLAALLELMPEIKRRGYLSKYPTLLHNEHGYYFNSLIYTTYCYNNPIEPAFEMICWLLENNYIETKKL